MSTENQDEMKIPISPARASTLTSNLSQVQARISSTTKSHSITKPIRLIAVSKLKPASDILALHNEPTSHQHFGENYVQELVEKSKLLPKTIRWHFIGGLQSNKCKELAKEVPNLWAVESVDSVKKANLLNKGRSEAETPSDSSSKEPLRIFIQINTSGEESKSGIEPQSPSLLELAKQIHGDDCPHLKLQGLMTIGAIARSKATTAETENEDFVSLRENRDWLAKEMGIDGKVLELSMGMSESTLR